MGANSSAPARPAGAGPSTPPGDQPRRQQHVQVRQRWRRLGLARTSFTQGATPHQGRQRFRVSWLGANSSAPARPAGAGTSTPPEEQPRRQQHVQVRQWWRRLGLARTFTHGATPHQGRQRIRLSWLGANSSAPARPAGAGTSTPPGDQPRRQPGIGGGAYPVRQQPAADAQSTAGKSSLEHALAATASLSHSPCSSTRVSAGPGSDGGRRRLSRPAHGRDINAAILP